MNDTTTTTINTETGDRIRAGHWYYIMEGIGGSESRYIAAVAPDGHTRGGTGMFRMFGRDGSTMQPLPATPSWLAIDEDGHEYHISANDLDGIGIGSIEEAFDHAPLLTPERLAELRDRRRRLDAEEAAAKAKADAEFKAEVERIKAAPEYAHIPNRSPESRMWPKEITANIRADLAHTFPGVKFSVRKSEFSGGWDVRVDWEDGPSVDDVQKVVHKFEPVQTLRPDDYMEEEDTAFNAVFGSVSYLFVERTATSAESRALRDADYTKWRETSYYVKPAPAPRVVAQAKPAKVDGVTVSENAEKGGIEIRFPARPADTVLASLKARGWRWSKFAACWYHRADEAARAFAASLAGGQEKHEEPTFDLDLMLGY